MRDRVFVVSVPLDPAYLKSIRAFFKSILVNLFGDQAEMLVLALDESCSNVMKYRCGDTGEGVLRVKAEILDDLIRFQIENFCASKDVPKIKPRELAEVRPGGLGTHFVKSIMDRVEFEPQPEHPGWMTLVLEKALPE